MAFGWTAATWLAVGAGVTGVATLASVDQARRQGNQAADRARAQQLAADEANNKANAKTPDATALMAANLAASKNGQAGTLLTGPGGVDPNSLKLGRSTLLGGG